MLPIPNEREVEEFRKICDEKLSMKLDGREALEAATLVLQISYIRQYGLTDEQRKRELARLSSQKENPHHGELPK